MKISLVYLTFNRKDAVIKTLIPNLEYAGYPIHEIVHVDNGSSGNFADWFDDVFEPNVQVRHKTNLGVSKGYNRGMALATGSHIVITGVDRLMPKGWLRDWVTCFEKIPHTAAVCMFSSISKRHHRHRYLSEPEQIQGINLTRCLPYEARMHSREFLMRTGFFREDFGLYGFEDLEWAGRAGRVAREQGLITYTTPKIAETIVGDDYEFLMPDGSTYQAFKDKYAHDEEGKRKWNNLIEANYPYYNPFSRIEDL